jgi:dipeptidyl aminopeptidase/acylaminoacyl peptidase
MRLFGWSAARLAGLFVALLAGLPPAPARDPDTDRQVAELEKRLADLKKKLAELKKADPPAARKPLGLADTLAWKGIRTTALSRDGQWFAYRVGPAEGDNEVVVRRTRGEKQYKFPAGKAGPVPGQLAFSHDGKWLAFSIPPARRARPPRSLFEFLTAPPATTKVALVDLATGKKVEYDGARGFAFSGESAALFAVHRAPEPAASGSGSQSTAKRPAGTDLLLRRLDGGKELTLGNVAQFGFDKKGRWLALLIDAKDQAGNGVQLFDVKTSALRPLESGKATYQGLAWTEKGDAFTALKGVEDKRFKDKLYSVLGFTDLDARTPTVVAYDPHSDSGFPKGMAVSPNRPAFFSEDLGAIFFGIHEPQKAEDKPASAPARDSRGGAPGKTDAPLAGPPSRAKAADKEKPDLVIWHWQDDRLQSEQQVQAGLDRTFSYLCAYRVKEKKFLRLADETLREVSVAPRHSWAVGLDDRAYRRQGNLDGKRFHDVYVVDPRTGKRKLALKKARWPFGVSPKGTHFLYYDDGHFHTYDMATGKTYNLTADAPVSFVDVEDDHNVDRPPCPPVGWSKDESAVLLSDNWDVWKFPAHGGPGVNLTRTGKKEGVRYRPRIRLDPEEKGIDLSVAQYFSAYGEWTKKAGFARVEPNGAGLTTLCWDDAVFSSLTKARDADVFVYTRQTYRDYPDYYLTDPTFKPARRLTEANPQQEKFRWCAGVRLLEYKSAKGDRLQAALLLPAGYEKGKRYPTVVYIYERVSQALNNYHQPSASGFNPAVYTSNGYAVLLPDIRYRVNDPGMSAVWCVLPALEAAVGTGVVDRQRVGLHGHSWGGYQTAFLITQAKAFRAAVAGAPLTDLVSMYSLIYWNTGWTNQPIFESSQGRFRAGYWDDLDAFIRNSPVFHAKNVTTPLLLLHNDKDGAVDWTQGIEYFNTLRRLDKPVVLLQYKGENHGLVKSANRKDYTVRMREFFDHHLRGKPAPGWLEKGVPHLKMDEHLKERAGKE